MKHRIISFIAALGMLLAATGFAQEQSADKTMRIYFIGNSVTDTVNYKGLQKLAESQGYTHKWGRHMIPGAPIFYMWQGENGFTEKPYGHAKKALSEFEWDVVSVQPFDRHIDKGGDQADLYNINEMIKAQVPKNPGVQFYIMGRWPRIRSNGKSFKFDKNDYDPNTPGDRPDLSQVDPYAPQWEKEYTGGWDGTNETRDYFEDLMKAVNEANPDLKNPVKIVPVGEVMYELDKKMRAGKVPGFDSIYLFYKDGIHQNKYGSYLTAVTFYATIYKESPIGLPSEPYGDLAPAAVKTIQETVWEVVQAYPHSGVEKEEK
ncbi:MAG: PEP-CTERM sorting domain-containing protein [bacterium]